MTFLQEALSEAQRYLVQRDPRALEAAIRRLEEELNNPSLQEAQVQLTTFTVETVSKLAESMNSVRLNNGDYVADGPIVEGLIRVLATDQPESSALILRVVEINDNCLILAPVLE